MIMLGVVVLMVYSRVWHPGFHEGENFGWAGAPDIVAEYKGKIVLGDLKTSNGPYYSQWPDSEYTEK